MPTASDHVDLDLGTPEGREAGFRHPAVLVTAQRILDADPSLIHVVLRAVPPRRVSAVRGNVGAATLAQIRDVIAVLLGLP